MSVKYAILGGLMKRPRYGYQFKVTAIETIAREFGINDGQIYPTLKKLEKEGLITKQVEVQDSAPNRHMYTITDKGRSEFLQWMKDTEGEERTFRYDFLRKDVFFSKCVFINRLDKESAIEKVQKQMETVEKTIEDLKHARINMAALGVDILKIKILGYGIMEQEARIEWLKQFMCELQTYEKFSKK